MVGRDYDSEAPPGREDDVNGLSYTSGHEGPRPQAVGRREPLSRAMEKILLIEDDPAVHKALGLLFESEGYTLEIASDGASGLEMFRGIKPALVVLDLRIPKVAGRDVCREIKKEAPAQPVIILSATSEEVDKVLMLELGADDYVTKPFSPRELLARARAVLRRTQPSAPASQRYTFADVVADFAKMEVTCGGELVPMTPHELKCLRYFLENPERVVSRDELLNQVWGYECYPSTRTVDNHILKLRQKLERDPANPVYFRTVHGAGYKFVPAGASSAAEATTEGRKPQLGSQK